MRKRILKDLGWLITWVFVAWAVFWVYFYRNLTIEIVLGILSTLILGLHIFEYREVFLIGYSRRIIQTRGSVALPNKWILPISNGELQVSGVLNSLVTIFTTTETHDFDYFYGRIYLQDTTGKVLGEILLPKLNGIEISLFGSSFKDLPKGKWNEEIMIKCIRVPVSHCLTDFEFVLDLDWNFRGWRNRREREIPSDGRASFEIDIFISPGSI